MNSMFFIATLTTADFWRQSSSSFLPAELRGILNAKICDHPAPSFCLGKNWPNILFYVNGDLRDWNVKYLKSFIVCHNGGLQASWWIIRQCNDAVHYHSFSVGTNTVIFTCIMPNIQGDKEPPQPGWLRLILYSLVSLPGLAWPSPSRAGEEIKDSFREN